MMSPDVLGQTLVEAGFSRRVSNPARTVGVITIGDLCRMTAEELLKLKCFGLTQLVEVREMLSDLGLSLKFDSPALDAHEFAEHLRAFLRDPLNNLQRPAAVLDLCTETIKALRDDAVVTVDGVIDFVTRWHWDQWDHPQEHKQEVVRKLVDLKLIHPNWLNPDAGTSK